MFNAFVHYPFHHILFFFLLSWSSSRIVFCHSVSKAFNLQYIVDISLCTLWRCRKLPHCILGSSGLRLHLQGIVDLWKSIEQYASDKGHSNDYHSVLRLLELSHSQNDWSASMSNNDNLDWQMIIKLNEWLDSEWLWVTENTNEPSELIDGPIDIDLSLERGTWCLSYLYLVVHYSTVILTKR